MSVADVLSPMSIDKSVVLNQSNASMNYSRSNEADKFFEMIDYQMDILDYLREAEVSS